MKYAMIFTVIWGLSIASASAAQTSTSSHVAQTSQVSQGAQASSVFSEAHVSPASIADGQGYIGIYGDDVFPWPWGSECPFPWAEIEGTYKIRGMGGRGPYSGHYVSFEAIESKVQNVKLLSIMQYDRRGQLYSKGQVYSSRDQRIVKGILRNIKNNDEYTVIVRSYVKDRTSTCRDSALVTAVTFCPLRGRRCLNDANYTLERLE
jgi:hypothetical protein